jgi:hypothetical protein
MTDKENCTQISTIHLVLWMNMRFSMKLVKNSDFQVIFWIQGILFKISSACRATDMLKFMLEEILRKE